MIILRNKANYNFYCGHFCEVAPHLNADLHVVHQLFLMKKLLAIWTGLIFSCKLWQGWLKDAPPLPPPLNV